jgi:hypothetical protein
MNNNFEDDIEFDVDDYNIDIFGNRIDLEFIEEEQYQVKNYIQFLPIFE